MSSVAGSNALMALKSKMKGLREELDKAHDQLEEKNREFEAEKEGRSKVTSRRSLPLPVLCRSIMKLNFMR